MAHHAARERQHLTALLGFLLRRSMHELRVHHRHLVAGRLERRHGLLDRAPHPLQPGQLALALFAAREMLLELLQLVARQLAVHMVEQSVTRLRSYFPLRCSLCRLRQIAIFLERFTQLLEGVTHPALDRVLRAAHDAGDLVEL